MAVMIQSTATVQGRGVKTLVYGGSGKGKTRLMGTAPYPIILSAEGGLLSLRSQNLPFIEINSIATLEESYNFLLSSREAQQFATVGLDSISEIIEVLLKLEKANTKDPRKAYGAIADRGVDICRSFRDLPGRNIVITAKEEWHKDEQSGIMMWGPSLPGSKLGPALPYFFDEVFRIDVYVNPQTKERTEYLRCRADGQSVAKDRSGSLNEFEPPNLAYIFDKIAQGGHAVYA